MRILMILATLLITAGCVRNTANNHQRIPGNEIKPVKDTAFAREYCFKALDKGQVLTRLFDNPVIDSSGAALWEPNYLDGMDLPVSFDGKCHTNVDTIMFFTDTKKRKCAAVIFTTYNYVKKHSDSDETWIGGSHFTGVPLGIALFKQSVDGDWTIYKFSKHFSELGYFGTYRTGRADHGEISLKEIGDKWTCLSLKQGIGGSGGISYGYESLYSIEEYQLGIRQKEDEVQEWYRDYLLQNMLTYNYYYSGYSPDENDTTRVEKLSVIKIVKQASNYYNIQMNINKNGKTSVETYYYSESAGMYLQK